MAVSFGHYIRRNFRDFSAFSVKWQKVLFRLDAWKQQPSFVETSVYSELSYYMYLFSVAPLPRLDLGHLILKLLDHTHTHTHTHTYIHTHTHTHAHTHTPHTHTHTRACATTPLDEWSARSSDPYLQNTEQTQQTNIHGYSGFRTRDPRNRGDAELRRRLNGQRHRPVNILADQTKISKLLTYISLIRQR
jgi:hypothetical protein